MSSREARGLVTGYRVITQQVNSADCPPQWQTNTTTLISNDSLSHRLDIPACASYVVTINARTEAGFNKTLILNEIMIPATAEGLFRHSHSVV